MRSRSPDNINSHAHNMGTALVAWLSLAYYPLANAVAELTPPWTRDRHRNSDRQDSLSKHLLNTLDWRLGGIVGTCCWEFVSWTVVVRVGCRRGRGMGECPVTLFYLNLIFKSQLFINSSWCIWEVTNNMSSFLSRAINGFRWSFFSLYHSEGGCR